MLKKIKRNITATKLLVVLMCLMILSSQSIYELSGWGKYLKLMMFALSIVVGLSSLFEEKLVNEKGGIFFFLVFTSYIFVLYILNSYNSGEGLTSFLITYLTLAFIFLYFRFNKLERYTNSYLLSLLTNIIIFFACISLIMWLIISIFDLVQPTQYVQLNWGIPHFIPSYFYVYFETQNVSFGSFTFMRNTWIYPEGPIYSFFLSFALAYNVFIKNNRICSKSSLILIITILTTGSSTGIIALAAMAFSRLITYLKKWGKLINSLVVIAATITLGVTIYFVIRQKTLNSQTSLNVRFEDIVAGYQSWLVHPVIGDGYGNYSILLSKMSSSRLVLNGNTGFSSGLSLLAAYGGLSLLLIYFIPIFKGIYIGGRNNINILFFSLIIIFLLLTTIVQTNFVMLITLPFLLTLRKKSTNQKEHI